MSESSKSRNERRSTRVEVEIPIIITSVKSKGKFYEGPGVTLMVNKHGAKIVTLLRFNVGDYVRLTIPASTRSQLARVAWVDQTEPGMARVSFGIALEEPENFWGVYFPPGDWDDPPSWEDWEKSEGQQTHSPVHRRELPKTHDPNVALGPGSPAGSSALPKLPPIEIYEEGNPVYVRGISAAHSPFQEQTWLLPVGGQEATVRLRAVVDVGRLVQVVFPTDTLIVRAHTTGVGDQAREGKWTTWLRLDALVRIIPKLETE